MHKNISLLKIIKYNVSIKTNITEKKSDKSSSFGTYNFTFFIDRFSKIGTFLFRSFFLLHHSLSRFPVNEMKNLLIGSRGDPKSISRKKGSPKCDVPYFHKKSEFRKKRENDGFNKKLRTAIWEFNRGGNE